MASKNIVEVVIKATDQASKKLGGLNKTIKMLGIGAAAAGAAVLAAGVIIGKTVFNLAKESAQVEKLRGTFNSLADSIGENADLMIKDLRVASRGMLNDADLMQASNKLVAMGLADTTEESAKLVEMSTQLGSAMGMTATDSAEAFALMLANQSIPRLDNFGISSGKVRDRILELMEAEEGMTRETAFMTAVMEEGGKTMEKVGEQGEGAAANMARLEANIDNLKVEIGNRLLPVLEVITDKLLVMWDSPQVQAGLDNLFNWLENVIGDEESGLIGIMTALLSGEIEKGFDMAFGQGAYGSVIKVIVAIDALLNRWDRFYTGFASTNNAVTRWINEAQRKVFNLMDVINIPHAPRVPWPLMNVPGESYRGPRAAGGLVSSGGSYLVGEEGPEILSMGRNSGYITPNNKLGGVTINLHVHSAVSLSDMANAERVLLPMVEKGLRMVMAR